MMSFSQYFFSNSSSVDLILFDGLAWTTGVLVVGGFLRLLTPKFSRLGLLILLLSWQAFGVGWVETLVVVFWILSAWSIGAILLRWIFSASKEFIFNSTEAMLVGGCVLIGIWGLMFHFPINYQLIYLVICFVPIFWCFGLSSVNCSNIRVRAFLAHDWILSIPFSFWVAGLALIGWVLRWSSFPSVSYDDHAQHLRLWTELLTQRRALFDVHTQIWAVAPFATDLLHAGLSLMAGTDARSAMNLALTLILLVLFMRILQRLNLSSWVQWLLMVLMASTPMLGNLLLSLQTELLLAVLSLAGLRLVIEVDGNWRGQHVLGVLACAALCTSIKLPGAVLGATLLASLALRWWSLRVRASQSSELLPWSALLVLVPLAFVALHSYALAWWATGNPVFPLYNAFFLSPLFPFENFSDSRWIRGFNLYSYVRAFFKTSEFFESGDYVAGWQYLFLLPISIVALWRSSVPSGLRIALVPLLGFGLVMFSATQYWRYLFPVMPIASVLFAALFIENSRRWIKVFSFLTLISIILNMTFFPRISWMMRSSAQTAYTNVGKEHISRIYAPVAVLTAEVNRIAPGSSVLYPKDTPYGATLHGNPLYTNWYAPARAARFFALNDPQAMARFLVEEKVGFVIVNMSDLQASETSHTLLREKSDPIWAAGSNVVPNTLLREHLAKYGVAVAKEGNFILYRLSNVILRYETIFDSRSADPNKLENSESLLPISSVVIEATPQPRVIAVFPTQRASQARYRVRMRCPSKLGFFIAQINWDVDAPYYRLVNCSAEEFTFSEAIPVPFGARQGELYVTVRDTTSAKINYLQVELIDVD